MRELLWKMVEVEIKEKSTAMVKNVAGKLVLRRFGYSYNESVDVVGDKNGVATALGTSTTKLRALQSSNSFLTVFPLLIRKKKPRTGNDPFAAALGEEVAGRERRKIGQSMDKSKRRYLSVEERFATHQYVVLNCEGVQPILRSGHVICLRGGIVFFDGDVLVSATGAMRANLVMRRGRNETLVSVYGDPFPEPIRVSAGRTVTGLSGNMRTHIFPRVILGIQDREFICITDDLNLAPVVIKRDGMYGVKKTSYVVCNFDIDLLPVRYNLPMVCPPRDWDVSSEAKRGGVGRPQTLSDLTGGELVESGLLMPSFLSRINIPEAINLLRKTFLEDEIMVKKKYKFQDILKEFLSRVQRSRYERFIVELASAYVDYEFYLPAFDDFRGRIYRARVLHFHERDLARSLIVFSKNTYRKYDDGREYDDDQIAKLNHIIESAAGFHYHKFETYGDASQWYQEQHLSLKSNDSRSLIKFAGGASDPFQFLIPKAIDEDEKRKIHDIYTHILEDLKDYLKKVLPEDEYSVILKGFPRKLVKSIFMSLVYGTPLPSAATDLRLASCPYTIPVTPLLPSAATDFSYAGKSQRPQ
nr:DNA-dependent RNA polymerase [Ipomoea batatas]